MFATIKSEFRKLFSVRSTYVITGIAFAIVIFYAFYIEGIRADHVGSMVTNPLKLASEVTGAINAVAVIGALAGLLLFTHEYRYNTIMYTLTSAKSRTQVLFAKIMVVSCYALVFSLIVGALAPTMAYLGMHVKGYTLVHQNFATASLAWRALFVGWGYAMAGLLFAGLIRSQVGAIITLFIVPGTVESLLGLLLKNNVVYLPFTALQAVTEHPERGTITYGHAALVFMGYLVFGWIVAWILFLRRDAN